MHYTPNDQPMNQINKQSERRVNIYDIEQK